MEEGHTAFVEMSVYGVRKKSTLSKLEGIAKKPYLMFRREVSQVPSGGARVPPLLGTFIVTEKEVTSLIRSLRSLGKDDGR